MTASDDALFREEPLDLSTWLSETGRVLDELNRATEADEERLLRRSFHLSHLAPPPLWAVLSSRQTEAAFEQALAQGVSAEAMGGLVNPKLKRDVTERHGLIAVELTSEEWGVTGEWESRSEVLALIGAWVKCSLALVARIGAARAAELTDPRKSRSARHLKSSEH